MKKLGVLLAVMFMMGCQQKLAPSVENPLWANLDLILTRGGLPAVILLFGYLYLRSIQKATGKQIQSMQEQIAVQQETMIAALNNNTKALTTLSTAMIMGCPFIRSHLLPPGDGDGSSKPQKDGGCPAGTD